MRQASAALLRARGGPRRDAALHNAFRDTGDRPKHGNIAVQKRSGPETGTRDRIARVGKQRIQEESTWQGTS